ncbi:MAG: hypothetical protein ACHQIG_03725, partial [Acidimicrobiia bacterium]
MDVTAGVRRSSVAPGALALSTLALAAVIVFDATLPAPLHITLVFAACTGYVTMTIAQNRWGGLSIRFVTGAVAAQCVAAVAVPPRATGDLWWYAIYGRLVA